MCVFDRFSVTNRNAVCFLPHCSLYRFGSSRKAFIRDFKISAIFSCRTSERDKLEQLPSFNTFLQYNWYHVFYFILVLVADNGIQLDSAVSFGVYCGIRQNLHHSVEVFPMSGHSALCCIAVPIQRHRQPVQFLEAEIKDFSFQQNTVCRERYHQPPAFGVQNQFPDVFYQQRFSACKG